MAELMHPGTKYRMLPGTNCAISLESENHWQPCKVKLNHNVHILYVRISVTLFLQMVHYAIWFGIEYM